MMRKFFPFLVVGSLLIANKNFAQEIPLIPLQSSLLFREAEKLNEWKKVISQAAPLQYFSTSSQEIALNQYLINAKLFLLRQAVSSIFFPMKKLELQQDLFQANLFQLTKKYCEVDIKTNFDWGSLARQLFLLAKDNTPANRWDDEWSKSNLPLDMQQKIYTTRIVRALDAIKYLCVRETTSEASIVKVFLKDEVLAANFTRYLNDSSALKFYCESPLFCRQVTHADFVKRLPRSMLDYPWDKEMVNLWKTFVDGEATNWEMLKQAHKQVSMISTKQSILHLRDEFVKASDFFMIMSVMTKNKTNSIDDPLLLSLKPLLDNLASVKIQKYSNKVEWEEPFEIDLKNSTESQNFLAMDLVTRKGGMDQMIEKIDKIKIRDSITFDRGFLEWLLRATLNTRYYNELLYWKNRETIHSHLVAKIQYYIESRKKVMPYLNQKKMLASSITDWILDKRNDIAQYLSNNPDQREFNFIINHYLGLSALESNLVSE